MSESEIINRAQVYGHANLVPYSHSVRAFIEGSQELTRMAQRFVMGLQQSAIATEPTLAPMWELVGKLEEWSGTPPNKDLTEG